ncbi:hypothetical protein ACSSV4_000005 [Roseovarius sp. MBR-154]|jgi:hypothetical protein
MTDHPDRLAAQLDALLETERAALLRGDLGAIAAGVAEKERLIAAFEALGPRHVGLADLQAKVIRNQALFDGALQGIRSVALRIANFRRIRKSMETYDQQGRKQTIPGDIVRTVEKRA